MEFRGFTAIFASCDVLISSNNKDKNFILLKMVHDKMTTSHNNNTNNNPQLSNCLIVKHIHALHFRCTRNFGQHLKFSTFNCLFSPIKF